MFRQHKQIKRSDIVKEELCNHNKVYANIRLFSNPPQHPWICSICGERGGDVEKVSVNYYDQLVKKFSDIK